MTTDFSRQFPLSTKFLQALLWEAPAFSGQVMKTARERPELFYPLAERMLGWARPQLGSSWTAPLIDGYLAFVIDVNRSQTLYEETGHYEFSSYEEVYNATYNNPDFMQDYHWGVFVTTFAWEHHLSIYEFFYNNFLLPLAKRSIAGRLLDLGCGSGIWSITSLENLPGWTSTMVDISETSVALTREMLRTTGCEASADLHCADALSFRAASPCDAAVSFFLLEHLETPKRLLTSLAENLKSGAPAFITTALTAAETDHIYEFRRESEVVALAEDAGFRVVAMMSETPNVNRGGARFLPRSMALSLVRQASQAGVAGAA